MLRLLACVRNRLEREREIRNSNLLNVDDKKYFHLENDIFDKYEATCCFIFQTTAAERWSSTHYFIIFRFFEVINGPPLLKKNLEMYSVFHV